MAAILCFREALTYLFISEKYSLLHLTFHILRIEYVVMKLLSAGHLRRQLKSGSLYQRESHTHTKGFYTFLIHRKNIFSFTENDFPIQFR